MKQLFDSISYTTQWHTKMHHQEVVIYPSPAARTLFYLCYPVLTPTILDATVCVLVLRRSRYTHVQANVPRSSNRTQTTSTMKHSCMIPASLQTSGNSGSRVPSYCHPSHAAIHDFTIHPAHSCPCRKHSIPLLSNLAKTIREHPCPLHTSPEYKHCTKLFCLCRTRRDFCHFYFSHAPC